MDITIRENKKFNKFLCEFFSGVVHGYDIGIHQDAEMKKDAETNFRRFYKLLNTEEKIDVKEQLDQLKTDPQSAIDALLSAIDSSRELFD